VRGKPLFVEALWTQMSKSRSVFKLWLLFSAEMVVLAIVRLAIDLSFNSYAFADRGSFLSVCYLATHGSHPAIDFGYPYGLLSIFSAQAWFHVFGLSPRAENLAMLVCALFATWGLARFASGMRLGTVGVVLLAIALPFTILPSYQSFVYALEASLLCNALAEQAAGRRANALALATAACLAKPSMGYLYGLILVLLSLFDGWCANFEAESQGIWQWMLKSFAPTAITGGALLSILAAVYGIPSVAATLIPTSGRAIYRAIGYGSVFFSGRGLWYEPKGGLPFYLLTVAGFWIAASLWLVAAGLRAGWRIACSYRIRTVPRVVDEFVFTCAVLHVMFVTTFFGSPTSWEYYSYLLVMGVAATSIGNVVSARVAAGLALLAFFGSFGHVQMALDAWGKTVPAPQTRGLWSSTAERKAWARVLAVTAGHDAVALTFQGCAALLGPFAPPIGAYLVPHEALPAEVRRTFYRVKHAPMVFAVTSSDYGAALAFFPKLRDLLDKRKIVLNESADGITFTVYGAPKASVSLSNSRRTASSLVSTGFRP
jgi:hypothetical protein